MAYSRVAWVEKRNGVRAEEECTVPTCWLQKSISGGQVIRWPSVVNAEPLIRKKVMPQSSWRTYKVIKVKHQSGNCN